LVVMSISFCSELHCSPQDLHSFPTRRSSDLIIVREGEGERPSSAARIFARYRGTNLERERFDASNIAISLNLLGDGTQIDGNSRSEEHTSELQSRENLVCRLLLEKKKKHECR